MPFDPEDKQTDISGDPAPQKPMTQKQVAGAQSAAVNRTQIGPKGPLAGSGQSPTGEGDKPPDAGGDKPGGGVTPDTPVLGGAEALGAAAQAGTADAHAQAQAELHLDPRSFNPFNGMDWLKRAAESPLSTYHLGRHVYDAFFGAFLNSDAITASVQNVQQQDNAQSEIFKFLTEGSGLLKSEQDRKQQEEMVAQGAGVVLPITANPWNILPFGGARGAALVALMLTPTAAQAIFDKGDPQTALLWGGAAAMLFGGKLPPSVEAKLAKEAPQALKLFDKIGATQRAIDKNRIAMQDRKTLLDKVLAQAQEEKNVEFAPAWDSKTMTTKGADWEKNISKRLKKTYGTLDRSKLVDKMLASGASQAEVSTVWTYLMKMPEPLMYHEPAEAALVNPVSHMTTLPQVARAEVEKGHHWALHMINQTELGPAGNFAAPEASHWRSLIGIQSTNDLVGHQYELHLREVAGAEASNPAEQDLLLRALEGDDLSYQKLSPQMKYVRDSLRMVRAGLRMGAKDSGFSTDHLNNYAPRTHTLVRDGKGYRVVGSGVLTQQAQRHRVLGTEDVGLIDEKLRVVQRYPTTQAAQAAVKRLQGGIADQIINGTPIHEITGVPRTDENEIDAIRSIATSHPDIARAEAEEYAKKIAPDFEMDPFKGISHDVGYLRSIAAFRAVQGLLHTLGKDGRAIAVERPTNDAREVERLLSQGYHVVNAPGFSHVLISGDYAELLARATRGGRRKSLGEAVKSLDPKALAHLEGEAVKKIMYSPRIHGMNMAFRLGVLGTMHPLEVTRWFKEGLLQKPGVTHVGHEDYRMEAWNARVIPPTPGTLNWTDEISNVLGNHTGDSEIGMRPVLRDLSKSAAKASSGAKLVAGKVTDLLWGKQSDLWSWVSDFGVMAYHIEKSAAMHGGMPEAEAMQYAARRANSWMGHVAPEDTNPALHAIAKTVTFAPNYWRSYAELLTGVYRRAGWGWTNDTIRYVVQNEIKTAMAMVAFQQLTANAMNMMLGGHTIYQNDPGNWGKIEITQPWAIEALNKTGRLTGLNIDPKTGRNAKGQKLTMENMLARQMKDTEDALGLLTSSPHWDPASLEQGSRAFAAGRLSPVVGALGALANIDVYSSIASGGTRYMDPNHDHLFGNPAFDAVAAGAELTPFSYITGQMQQSMLAGQDPTKDMDGPFGTKIPKVVTDTFGAGALAGDAARMIMVGMTGINPPYMRSSKTFGVQPTDDQYKSVHEIQDTYHSNMNALSTATLTGQMTPYQWLSVYRQLSTKRAGQLQAIFKHAPDYNDGPLGLVNSWENLYDQAATNGITDPDKLRALQRDWRNQHSAAEYAAMHSELRSSDTKYPMLALYHKTLDAYSNWQSDYAKSNGIDLETLRSELSGYAQRYNDRVASEEWLRDHPDIQPFQNAKKSEFESGQSHFGEAGLMYALFFNPTGAQRYLAAASREPAQVITDVQNQQVPPGP